MKSKFPRALLTKYLFFSVAYFLFGYNCFGQKSTAENLNIGAMVQPVPVDAMFVEEGYYIWGGSMTKGNDNKYHLFYSRWPAKLGFSAWVTNSEIAHAVADGPNGPYKFVNIILPARGTQYWDGTTTHNPTVLFRNGKYYLYYMGTTGDSSSLSSPITSTDTAWWNYRNNQRIGVAISRDPAGVWLRFDKPVLDVGKDPTAYDALITSNPAVAFGPGNEVVLIYKEVEKNGTRKGGKVRFGVAFAKSPTGPFVKEKTPVFEVKSGKKDWMVAEDPYIWYDKGYYYAIVRDVVGRFTGIEGSLALLVSKDAKKWLAAKHPRVIGKTFEWANGTDSETKIERPQLYREDRIPKILFGAIRYISINNKGKHDSTANIRVPLKANY